MCIRDSVQEANRLANSVADGRIPIICRAREVRSAMMTSVRSLEAYLLLGVCLLYTSPPKQRALIARLAQGAAGRALAFDLDSYTAARADALIFLRNAANIASQSEPDHTALFKMTETYRAGADGQRCV